MFGRGMLDGPRDGRYSRLLLGWLPDVVIAPHFGNYPVVPWREAFPACTILGLPDSAVALVTEGGARFASVGEVPLTVLRPGEHGELLVQPWDSWNRFRTNTEQPHRARDAR
jgi:hypothetical protein